MSLRWRLLTATWIAITAALLLAGIVLGGLFRDHVLQQFQGTLTHQLDELTSRLDFDAQGQPVLEGTLLSDPRWQRPYSGLYWQVDEMAANGQGRIGVLRSRSLWDANLQLGADSLPDGAVHVHQGRGPKNAEIVMLERWVRPADAPADRWRIVVAAELQGVDEAVNRFTSVLAVSLAVLLVLLMLAAWAQVAIGLRPLRVLQRCVQDVRSGRTGRLQGEFPTEVQPLVNEFNGVLDRNAEVVARARTHAGNLAHALKTPLSVLDQATAQGAPASGTELARLVQEQLGMARRHVDWHLAQARMAAAQRLPGQRTAVIPVVQGLVRVMQRVHAARALEMSLDATGDSLFFAGEEQDLHEILGNLLDNACKWAHSRVGVRVSFGAEGSLGQIAIEIEDDGPGIGAEHLKSVIARGERLDESTPGTGLGLAIVQDLVGLYGGHLQLRPLQAGGLVAALSLPAAH